jgi:hypothetical protein
LQQTAALLITDSRSSPDNYELSLRKILFLSWVATSLTPGRIPMTPSPGKTAVPPRNPSPLRYWFPSVSDVNPRTQRNPVLLPFKPHDANPQTIAEALSVAGQKPGISTGRKRCAVPLLDASRKWQWCVSPLLPAVQTPDSVICESPLVYPQFQMTQVRLCSRS